MRKMLIYRIRRPNFITDRFSQRLRTIPTRGRIVRSNVFSSETWVLCGLALLTLLSVTAMVAGGSDIFKRDYGSVITVEQDGSGNYTSIQEAIDAAKSGDAIVVGNGTFTENLAVDKELFIYGQGAGNTIIEGQGGSDVVNITGNGTRFSGFSITGKEKTGAGIVTHGIYVQIYDNHCSNKTVGIVVNGIYDFISNNTCSQNSDSGIRITTSVNVSLMEHSSGPDRSVFIINNTCTNNKNYGIHIKGADTVWVENNICSAHTYGIYGSDVQDLLIGNNTCFGNNEHGIFLTRSENCSVVRNDCANNVNGIFLLQSDHTIFERNNLTANVKGLILANSNMNDVIKNRCKNNQEGINLETSESNDILGNNCSENEGNGIHLSNDASNNRLEFNSVYDNGERGLYVRASSNHNVIENNTFVGNRIGIRVVQNSVNNSARSNNIFNNRDWGIYVGDESEAVNASGSWWWFPSGPYHETENPEGEGDNISDYVSFLPVKTRRINQRPTVTIEQPRELDVTIDEGDSIGFDGKGEDWGEVVRYVWISSKDGELYNGSNQVFSTSELSPGEHVISLRVQDDLGAWSEEVSVRVTVVENDEGMSTSVVVGIIIVIVLVIVGGLVQAGVVPRDRAKLLKHN